MKIKKFTVIIAIIAMCLPMRIVKCSYRGYMGIVRNQFDDEKNKPVNSFCKFITHQQDYDDLSPFAISWEKVPHSDNHFIVAQNIINTLKQAKPNIIIPLYDLYEIYGKNYIDSQKTHGGVSLSAWFKELISEQLKHIDPKDKDCYNGLLPPSIQSKNFSLYQHLMTLRLGVDPLEPQIGRRGAQFSDYTTLMQSLKYALTLFPSAHEQQKTELEAITLNLLSEMQGKVKLDYQDTLESQQRIYFMHLAIDTRKIKIIREMLTVDPESPNYETTYGQNKHPNALMYALNKIDPAIQDETLKQIIYILLAHPKTYVDGSHLQKARDLKDENLKTEILKIISTRATSINVNPEAFMAYNQIIKIFMIIYHPDKGGSEETMKLLIDIKETLNNEDMPIARKKEMIKKLQRLHQKTTASIIPQSWQKRYGDASATLLWTIP